MHMENDRRPMNWTLPISFHVDHAVLEDVNESATIQNPIWSTNPHSFMHLFIQIDEECSITCML